MIIRYQIQINDATFCNDQQITSFWETDNDQNFDNANNPVNLLGALFLKLLYFEKNITNKF